MKTFKDLKFKTHPLGERHGIQALINFDDGSQISVIQGPNFYSSELTYEMMSNRFHRKDDVRGYLSPRQITRHMIYIQKNPLNKLKTIKK